MKTGIEHLGPDSWSLVPEQTLRKTDLSVDRDRLNTPRCKHRLNTHVKYSNDERYMYQKSWSEPRPSPLLSGLSPVHSVHSVHISGTRSDFERWGGNREGPDGLSLFFFFFFLPPPLSVWTIWTDWTRSLRTGLLGWPYQTPTMDAYGRSGPLNTEHMPEGRAQVPFVGSFVDLILHMENPPQGSIGHLLYGFYYMDYWRIPPRCP